MDKTLNETLRVFLHFLFYSSVLSISLCRITGHPVGQCSIYRFRCMFCTCFFFKLNSAELTTDCLRYDKNNLKVS